RPFATSSAAAFCGSSGRPASVTASSFSGGAIPLLRIRSSNSADVVGALGMSGPDPGEWRMRAGRNTAKVNIEQKSEFARETPSGNPTAACPRGSYASAMPEFVSHLEAALDGTVLPAGRLANLHNGRPIWVRYHLH